MANDLAGSTGVGGVTEAGPLLGLVVESVSTSLSDGAASTRLVNGAVPNLSLMVVSTDVIIRNHLAESPFAVQLV